MYTFLISLASSFVVIALLTAFPSFFDEIAVTGVSDRSGDKGLSAFQIGRIAFKVCIGAGTLVAFVFCLIGFARMSIHVRA